MSVEDRYRAWWLSLTRTQRFQAMAVDDAVPDWMTASLAECGILMIGAHLAGGTPEDVKLMPTGLRDFIASHRAAANAE